MEIMLFRINPNFNWKKSLKYFFMIVFHLFLFPSFFHWRRLITYYSVLCRMFMYLKKYCNWAAVITQHALDWSNEGFYPMPHMCSFITKDTNNKQTMDKTPHSTSLVPKKRNFKASEKQQIKQYPIKQSKKKYLIFFSCQLKGICPKYIEVDFYKTVERQCKRMSSAEAAVNSYLGHYLNIFFFLFNSCLTRFLSLATIIHLLESVAVPFLFKAFWLFFF